MYKGNSKYFSKLEQLYPRGFDIFQVLIQSSILTLL